MGVAFKNMRFKSKVGIAFFTLVGFLLLYLTAELVKQFLDMGICP